ncbi:hypothetical protein CL3_06190 [butyrate-producing bacterium SM4/1]|nr:hypothetical protein CL3_06190 [butyrate-producing bacterium SM4/1]
MLYFIGKSVKPARLERQKEKALETKQTQKANKNESARKKRPIEKRKRRKKRP